MVKAPARAPGINHRNPDGSVDYESNLPACARTRKAAMAAGVSLSLPGRIFLSLRFLVVDKSLTD
jgi:hypothetical protein